MNNNRLSTRKQGSADNVYSLKGEQLYIEINKLLSGPSNIKIIGGRSFILSLNRFYKGNVKTKVQLVDMNNSVFKIFNSLRDCAKFLGVSRPTVKNRLIKNQLFVFEEQSFYIKILNTKDVCESKSDRSYKLDDKPSSKTKLKMNSILSRKEITSDFFKTLKTHREVPRPPTSQVYVYEKCSEDGFQLIG